MPVIFELIKRIITSPKLEAIILLGFGQFIAKQINTRTMNDETTLTVEDVKAKQPLWLPRGTIRALITLVLVGIVGASFVWNFEIPEEFLALTIFAAGYYVGYRTDNSQLQIIKN